VPILKKENSIHNTKQMCTTLFTHVLKFSTSRIGSEYLPD
jgi:hypothetical protein